MKTVRILSGGYGLKEHGRTRLIMKGETCSVEDSEAERLAAIGAAVIIEQSKADVLTEAVPAQSEDAEAEIDAEEEVSLEELTNAQLKEMCADLGINTKTLTNKTKLINAIREAQDAMPDLDAEDFE